MMQHKVLLEPASTRRVMATLGLAIDEAILARRITTLSHNLRQVESTPSQVDRARFMRQELQILEESLMDIRNKANI